MSTTASEETTGRHGPVPESVDNVVGWLVAGLLVLGGILVSAIGVAVYGGADRAWIAELVEEGRIESAELTNAELIDVTYGLAWWVGIGLMVTGVLLTVAGIVYLGYRRRARARRVDLDEATPDTPTNAIAGGLVTVFTSFVPFSPVLGGIVAGYLQSTDRTEGIRVGAYAGLAVAAPLAVLFLFLVGGAAAVAADLSVGTPTLVAVVGLFVGLLVTVAVVVGLSALGGYLGAALGARNSDETPA